MNLSPISSQKIIQSTPITSKVQKIKTIGSSLFSSITTRFKNASEEFHTTIELEHMKQAYLQNLTQATQDGLSSAQLSGFLIAEDSSRVIELYLGSNFLTLSQKGEVTLARGFTNNLSESDYEIELRKHNIVVDSLKDGTSPSTYESNDTVLLGKLLYQIKLLPEEYRVEQKILARQQQEISNDTF